MDTGVRGGENGKLLFQGSSICFTDEVGSGNLLHNNVNPVGTTELYL